MWDAHKFQAVGPTNPSTHRFPRRKLTRREVLQERKKKESNTKALPPPKSIDQSPFPGCLYSDDDDDDGDAGDDDDVSARTTQDAVAPLGDARLAIYYTWNAVTGEGTSSSHPATPINNRSWPCQPPT